MWGFGAVPIGLNVQFYRAAVPHQPVQVAMNRSVRNYHDQTTRPLHDIRWEMLTLLSHGAFVTVVDKLGFDGSLDPVVYERLAEAFQEAQAKRAHWGHKPVYEVGLYFSSRTRDWIGREQPLRWMQSFLGAQKAMVYQHIPYGVVLDENATPETLQQFPVVILPNVGILSEPEVALLDRYVQEGGRLIVTGFSGQFDRGRAVRGFAYHIQVRLAGQHAPQPISHHRMIVGNQQSDHLGCSPGRQENKQTRKQGDADHDGCNGSVTATVVPWPEALSTTAVPPSCSARWRMAARPKPSAGADAAKPTPSSCTSSAT
jgi:hypothetical protein